MVARLAGSGCPGGYEGKLPAGVMVEGQPYCCGVIVLSQVVMTASLTRITASA